MTTAGQLAGLAVNPGAPVSLTLVGCLESAAKNSELSLMTKNGGILIENTLLTIGYDFICTVDSMYLACERTRSGYRDASLIQYLTFQAQIL